MNGGGDVRRGVWEGWGEKNGGEGEGGELVQMQIWETMKWSCFESENVGGHEAEGSEGEYRRPS